MSDQPAERPDDETTTLPDPDEGPGPLDPDMPAEPGGADAPQDGGQTPATAADTAFLGTTDESQNLTDQTS